MREGKKHPFAINVWRWGLLILLLVVPYVSPIDPISIYMDAPAGNLANLMFPIKIS